MALLILISFFFALPISLFFWQHFPLPQLVQFPWRFLAITTFALATFVGGLPKRAGIMITFLVILLAVPFLKIDRTFQSESFYTTNDDTTTAKNEYMPKGVKVDPIKKGDGHHWVYFPGVEGVMDENGIVAGEKLIFKETPLRLFADIVSIGTFIFVLILWKRKF